jgi:hypothetical protein
MLSPGLYDASSAHRSRRISSVHGCKFTATGKTPRRLVVTAEGVRRLPPAASGCHETTEVGQTKALCPNGGLLRASGGIWHSFRISTATPDWPLRRLTGTPLLLLRRVTGMASVLPSLARSTGPESARNG